MYKLHYSSFEFLRKQWSENRNIDAREYIRKFYFVKVLEAFSRLYKTLFESYLRLGKRILY